MIFNIDTITAMPNHTKNSTVIHIFTHHTGEEVSPTWQENGKWQLNAQNHLRNNKSLERIANEKISSRATPSDSNTPTCEWLSLMWYDSPNMPEKIEPAAIPLVMVEEDTCHEQCQSKYHGGIITQKAVPVKTLPVAILFNLATFKESGCCKQNHSTVDGHPTIMEKSVSNSSYFNTLRMELSSFYCIRDFE